MTAPWPPPTDAEIASRCQRVLDDAVPKPLPEVARDFGHDPLVLDRVAREHSDALMARADGRQSAYARFIGFDEDGN